METYRSFTHFAPTFLIYFLLVSPSLSLNITAVLSPFPDLSIFSNLLLSTAVSDDLATVSDLTILAIPNSLLSTTTVDTPNIADILRYHILLQYLSPADLRHLPPSGQQIPTLFRSSSVGTSVSGAVNVTRDPETNSVSVSPVAGEDSGKITIVKLIKSVPYNITVYSVNSMMVPTRIDVMATESQQTLGLNVTELLMDGHNFNVAATMLEASGVSDELKSDETGAGITLFIPTDDTFSDLPPTVKIKTLTADKKAVLLKFHVLHSYYPLGSLQSIVNPVQPTLATESVGAGSYTLNISRVNGSVSINSGLIQASVTRTVFDEKPIAVFGIDRVLLPMEIFGSNSPIRTSTPPIRGGPPPAVVVPPETKAVVVPPETKAVIKSTALVKSNAFRRQGLGRYIGDFFCTVVLLYVLLV